MYKVGDRVQFTGKDFFSWVSATAQEEAYGKIVAVLGHGSYDVIVFNSSGRLAEYFAFPPYTFAEEDIKPYSIDYTFH